MRTSRALSRMSNSSSSTSDVSSKPFTTYTWHVEHAQTPPQRSPSGALTRRAASGVVVPTGTSTSRFSLMKRTLGTGLLLIGIGAEMGLDALGVCGLALDFTEIATGQRLGDAAVHAATGEGLGDVIEVFD